MAKDFENKKLDWCQNELKNLLNKLLEGNYHQTAEIIFDHVAHTGVETDINPELKRSPALDEFLSSQ